MVKCMYIRKQIKINSLKRKLKKLNLELLKTDI